MDVPDKSHLKKHVWNNLSTFILEKIKKRKGVILPNLGTFTFINDTCDSSGEVELRPIFILSEKICNNFKIESTKYKPANVILVEMNFSWLAEETGCSRDDAQKEIKRIVKRFCKSLATSKNVDLIFSRIGKLRIRNSKYKMKFLNSFLCDVNYKKNSRLSTSITTATNYSTCENPVRTPKSQTNSIASLAVEPPSTLKVPQSPVDVEYGGKGPADETEILPEVSNSKSRLCRPCFEKSMSKNDEFLRNTRRRREQIDETEYYKHIMEQKEDFENTKRKVEALKKIESQKVAAFNLGIAEAIRSLKKKSFSLQNLNVGNISKCGAVSTPTDDFDEKKRYFSDLKKQISDNVVRKTKEKTSKFKEERSNLLKLVEEVELFNKEQEKKKIEAMGAYKSELDLQVESKAKYEVKQEERDEIQSYVIYLQNKRPDFYNRKIAERTMKENNEVVRAVEQRALLEKSTRRKEEEEIIKNSKEKLKDELLSKYLKNAAIKEHNAREWIEKTLQKQQNDIISRKERFEEDTSLLLDQCCKYKGCIRCMRSFNNKHRKNFFPHFNSQMGGMYII